MDTGQVAFLVGEVPTRSERDALLARLISRYWCHVPRRSIVLPPRGQATVHRPGEFLLPSHDALFRSGCKFAHRTNDRKH